jgi:anti-sigma B factor antagonist
MSGCQYHLDVEQLGNVIVVRFGEHRMLDVCTVDTIKDELNTAADREGCRHLVLDFSGVEYASSTMLQELVMLRRKTQSKGRELTLVHVGSYVREVLV